MRYNDSKIRALSGRGVGALCLILGLPAPLPAQDLVSALEGSGWHVNKSADGSLILHPPASSRSDRSTPAPGSTPAMDRLADALTQRGWRVSRDADGNLILQKPLTKPKAPSAHTPVDEESLDRLRDRGWKVERDDEGNLRLYPPVPEKEHPPTVINGGSEAALDQGMKDHLRQAGWTIEEEADGALWLYPPDTTTRIHPCPGETPTAAVELPVDSWSKAHSLARAWVKKHQLTNVTVGRIRKILRIYLVSLVTLSSPHRLVHQLAIRSKDGHLILLD